MLKAKINSVNVTVPLTIPQFKRLDALDYLTVVEPALTKLGAYNIEYNGHFGANVFFTCTHQAQIRDIKKAIEKFVEEK